MQHEVIEPTLHAFDGGPALVSGESTEARQLKLRHAGVQPDDKTVAALAALPLTPGDFSDIKQAVLAAGAAGGADAHLTMRLAQALATINLASALASEARRAAAR